MSADASENARKPDETLLLLSSAQFGKVFRYLEDASAELSSPSGIGRPTVRARAVLGPSSLALAALLLASASMALTIGQLPSGAEYTVRSVRIDVEGDAPKSAVRDAMQTRLPPWYKPWKRWFGEIPFDPKIFENDLERVKTVLRESGYYQATVTYDLIPGDEQELDVLLRIEAGPAVKVSGVELMAVDFTLPEDDLAKLRADLPLQPDDVFTQEAYDESRAKLERFYLEEAFAYVEVQKAALVDAETNQSAVTYSITRHQPAVFGQTSIGGLQRVDAALVHREIAYETGEPYDPRKIEKTQANIFGLELFRSVVIKPANLEERSGVVDVQADVTEGPPRSIKVGIGYGLEDQLRAQLQWQHNNFFGGGRRLGFRLKGSFITQSLEGEFRQPYFLHPKQTFVLPLTQAREDEPAFTLLRSRLAPRVERAFSPTIRASLGYNIEYDDLTEVPDEVEAALDDFEARGFVSSLTGLIERNTTTDLLDPHEGSVLNLTVEQAGGPWQGDFDFYSAAFEAKKYVPLFGTRVLAGRFRIAAGDGFGQSEDLPLFRRFFAGGINSTRGYDRHELGPLTDDEDPIGGRSLMEGSIEFRTPVYKDLGAVVFLDAGVVDERAFHYPLNDLQYGVGPGIRYHTPIGPLRLDVGFAPNAPADLPFWQIHFSVGQAF